jgi:hypothetical protein
MDINQLLKQGEFGQQTGIVDDQLINETLAQWPIFKQQVESVQGLPRLPENYLFRTLEVRLDCLTFFYLEKNDQLNMPTDPDMPWETIEVYFDDELVYASISGLEAPLVHRSPSSFFHVVD